METTLLITALCAGLGYFLTDNFSRLLTILGLMDLYDGRKAARTATLGLALGVLTSLVGHRLDEVGYWLSVANGMVWTIIGGFLHSAFLAVQRPQAYAKMAFLVDQMQFMLSDYYADMMSDPVKLQAYLDRTYGKGLVNARDEVKRIQKQEGKRATTMSLEGAQKSRAAFEAEYGPLKP